MSTRCNFNPNEYNYCWGIDLVKTHGQSRCPQCELFTVWTNKKTGYTFSQCEGRGAVSRHQKHEKGAK